MNGAWANVPGKGRVLTTGARKWKDGITTLIQSGVRPSQAVTGKYDVLLEVPEAMAGDIDNRIKIALDGLVKSGRAPDDRHVREVTVRRVAGIARNDCRLTVTEAA